MRSRLASHGAAPQKARNSARLARPAKVTAVVSMRRSRSAASAASLVTAWEQTEAPNQLDREKNRVDDAVNAIACGCESARQQHRDHVAAEGQPELRRQKHRGTPGRPASEVGVLFDGSPPQSWPGASVRLGRAWATSRPVRSRRGERGCLISGLVRGDDRHGLRVRRSGRGAQCMGSILRPTYMPSLSSENTSPICGCSTGSPDRRPPGSARTRRRRNTRPRSRRADDRTAGPCAAGSPREIALYHSSVLLNSGSTSKITPRNGNMRCPTTWPRRNLATRSLVAIARTS